MKYTLYSYEDQDRQQEYCPKCDGFYTPGITICSCPTKSNWSRKYRNDKTYLDWLIELTEKKLNASLK